MNADEQPIVDWVNLPTGAVELSLWDTLHDGDLIAIKSDLMTQTLTLTFDVGYVRKFHKLPEATRFEVLVGGVQSVRSASSVPWPGGCFIPPETPNEEQNRIIAEYHSKWREDSLSWADFERLIDKGFEVSNASLAYGASGVALRLVLLVGNDSCVEAFIRGETVSFLIGEQQLTPEEFIALGEAYWAAFASRGASN